MEVEERGEEIPTGLSVSSSISLREWTLSPLATTSSTASFGGGEGQASTSKGEQNWQGKRCFDPEAVEETARQFGGFGVPPWC